MAVLCIPPLDADVRLVLRDFGPFGIAYVERSCQGRCDHNRRNLLHGQYDRPLRVIVARRVRNYCR